MPHEAGKRRPAIGLDRFQLARAPYLPLQELWGGAIGLVGQLRAMWTRCISRVYLYLPGALKVAIIAFLARSGLIAGNCKDLFASKRPMLGEEKPWNLTCLFTTLRRAILG
jgi:hypothetical protein